MKDEIYKILILLITVWVLFTNSTHAQFILNEKAPAYDQTTNTYLIAVPQEIFGKDYEANIILTKDSAWNTLKIDGKEVENFHYTFRYIIGNKRYALSATKNNQEIKAYITFTYLPILDLKGNFGYDYSKGSMHLQLPYEANTEEINIKAKWRGGSTNIEGKHKRNYKIKTLNAKGKSKDYSFLGMREDNNWILDAGQVDMFRLRNRIATELWNDFATKPYYSEQEPKAQTGVSGKVIEVFLNNEYRGIYCLTEAMDRKELKLKKYDDEKKEFHGMLWKTNGYGYATFWDIPENYDNNSETWNVFETKYPDIEDVCPTDYQPLWDAVNFVASSDDATFKSEVADYFDIPVLADYYIFLQIINGIDNIGKNMYWAIYDQAENKRLTPAIWDLDATVGQNYTDNPLHPDNTKPNNPLAITALNIFHRLIQGNVDNFKEKASTRYKRLRQKQLSQEELLSRYKRYFELIKNCGAANREEIKWSYDTDIAGNKLDFEKEYAYISEWIKQRLIFLDQHFSQLATNIKEVTTSQRLLDGVTYNLLGQKVNPITRGIYIKNGKKYIHP